MVSLEKVRSESKLTLQELGIAITNNQINPNDKLEVTEQEEAHLKTWAKNYREYGDERPY